MKFRFILLLILASITFQTAQSQPQSGFPQYYISSQWTMDEGLPASSVNGIIQSYDGYIWLATFGGLVRFDGVSFTVFNRSNTTGIKSDRILNIFQFSDSSLMCGTEDGTIRYKNGQFSTYTIKNNDTYFAPSMMTEDAEKRIWATADGEVYIFRDQQFHHKTVLTDSISAKKARTNPKGAWIFHRQKVLRTFGDSVAVVFDFAGKIDNSISDFIEYPKQSGIFWVATRGDGILKISDGKIEHFGPDDGLASIFARQFFIDASNNLWVVCFNGISRLEGDHFNKIKTLNDAAEKEYTTMTQDHEGNYWIGTPASGLRKLRPAIISMINEKQGLKETKMLSLTKRNDGSFLFATNCGGVYEYKNGKAHYSEISKHLNNLCVWSVFEDSKKRIWVGSRQLYRFNSTDDKGTLLDSTKGMYGLDIFSIIEDRKGNIWIGCQNGLYKYDGTSFTGFTTKDGLSDNDIRALYEDRNGDIWIGTAKGLNRYSNGKVKEIPITPSADNFFTLQSNYIRSIYQGVSGAYWFGTYGGGLVRLKGGRFSVITTANGLFDNIVSHILEDKRGFFWMGCNRGISRVSKQDLNDAADGLLGSFTSYVYNKSDGMSSAETNGGFQPSVITDNDGNIYFPTVSGVAVVNPELVHVNEIQPPVKIQNIVVNHRLFSTQNEIILPYDSSEIEIYYTALSYTDPEKNKYKYMLGGRDKVWHDVGSRRTAYYTDLPSGNYTFRVLGSNNDGVWSTEGAELRLTILPPFWQTWWFRSLIMAMIFFFILSIYYFQVILLKRKNKRQALFAEQLINSQEAERRRIAAELHDGLGQQILVMKNRAEMALKTIHDEEKTTEQLREISQNAAASINDVRSIAHNLRPVHLEQFGLTDTLIHLAEQLEETSPVEWVYHVDNIDGIIPKEKEINFYRIIQEGTNNILKHSGATQASMMVRRSEEKLTASLWDNGRGFNTDKLGKAAGLGITGILERVKSLGGICEIKSEPDEGSLLKIIIPIGKNGH